MTERGIMDGPAPSAKRAVARLRALAAVLLLFPSALAGCRSSPASAEPAFALAIEAENRRLEQLFRAGDLLGVADVYAEDAVLRSASGERVAGREEIDAHWSAIESPVEWRLELRKVRGSEALAYELGTSHLTTRRDGVLTTVVADFLFLWRREPDGAWRIELDASWPRPAD